LSEQKEFFVCSKCGSTTKLADYDSPKLYFDLKERLECESCLRGLLKQKEKKRRINLDYLFLSVAYAIDKKTSKGVMKTNLGDFLAKHKTVLQYVEFLFTGAIGLVPNFLVFNLLLGVNPYFAWFLAFVAGSVSNFILSKYGVFEK